MSNSDPESWPRLPLGPDELQQEAEKIIESGALGRSRIYSNLLRYLVNCANANSSPKEIEIAIDVLGRDESFDVAKDSAVRVYIYQLRKKLEHYYDKYAPDAPFHLTVPKGQYTLEARSRPEGQRAESTVDDARQEPATPEPSSRRTPIFRYLALGIIGLLLAVNLFVLLTRSDSPRPAASAHPLWQSILEDDTPILVVMGDYYIFGELDEAGNVARMIRDFSINSKQDLENLFAEQPALGWRYYDLDLNYLPEGSALVLNSLLPLLHSADKTVNMKMMSDLTTTDLLNNHVVYVGYISSLDRISNMVFAVSALEVGENYDQLINSKTGQIYTSSAGLPTHDQRFTDFGWFISLPSTRSTRLIMVAGMRDEGLVEMGRTLTDAGDLAVLDQALAASEQEPSAAYEALFRVVGLNRMSFDAELEYAGYLDADVLWRSGQSPEL